MSHHSSTRMFSLPPHWGHSLRQSQPEYWTPVLSENDNEDLFCHKNTYAYSFFAEQSNLHYYLISMRSLFSLNEISYHFLFPPNLLFVSRFPLEELLLKSQWPPLAELVHIVAEPPWASLDSAGNCLLLKQSFSVASAHSILSWTAWVSSCCFLVSFSSSSPFIPPLKSYGVLQDLIWS